MNPEILKCDLEDINVMKSYCTRHLQKTYIMANNMFSGETFKQIDVGILHFRRKNGLRISKAPLILQNVCTNGKNIQAR